MAFLISKVCINKAMTSKETRERHNLLNSENKDTLCIKIFSAGDRDSKLQASLGYMQGFRIVWALKQVCFVNPVTKTNRKKLKHSFSY